MSLSMKEQESNKYSYINPSLGADVIFWGIDVTRNGIKKDEGDKVKNFDVHPVHTWVMNVDRNDVIYVWDISTNKKLFHQSITQLLSLTESSCSTSSIDNGRAIITNNNMNKNRANVSNRNRYQSTSSSLSMSRYYKYGSSTSAFDAIILGSTISKDLTNSNNNNNHHTCLTIENQHIGSGKTIIKNNNTNNTNSNNSYANKDTSVKLVKFIDESCLNNHDMNNNLLYYTPSSFHTAGSIMIVCEVGVIFHSFLSFNQHINNSNNNNDENINNNSTNVNTTTNNNAAATISTRIITCADLNHKTPTSAEFIFHDICAIGCSDGIIRIWDCAKWGIIKQLSAHVKGDILVIKSLPILKRSIDDIEDSYNNTSNSNSMYERVNSTVSSGKGGSIMREGRIRMLTTGSDGASYIWDAGITGNIIEIFDTTASSSNNNKQQPSTSQSSSSSSAAYKLDQIGASSVAVCHSCFLDEDSNTLFTLSADHVIRMWDLDSLPVDSSSASANDNSSSSFNNSNNTSPRVNSSRIGDVGGNNKINNSNDNSGFTSTKEEQQQNKSSSAIRRGFASTFLSSTRNKKSNSNASDSDGFTGATSATATAASPSTRSTHSTSISHNNTTNNNTTNNNNRILQTVGKMKVSASTFPQPSLSKLTSFKAFIHPRYHSDTYLIAAKTNSFAMVQAQTHTLAYVNNNNNAAANSNFNNNRDRNSSMSSKRRANSFRHNSDAQFTVASASSGSSAVNEKALKVQPMHFFNLNVLMACYFRHLKHPLNVNLIAAAADPTIKIYKIHTHATYTSLVILGTSIGMVALNISPIQPGPYIGSHPHWGSGSTLTLSDNRLLYSTLTIPSTSDDTAVINTLRKTPGDDSSGLSRKSSGRILISSDSDKQPQGHEESFQLDLVNDNDDNNNNTSNNNNISNNNNNSVLVNVVHALTLTSSSATPSSATSKATVASLHTPNKSTKTSSNTTDSSSATQAQSQAALLVSEYFDLKILKSQPVMYSSPSGHFCTLFWPESSIYIVVKLNFQYASSSSSSSSSTVSSSQPLSQPSATKTTTETSSASSSSSTSLSSSPVQNLKSLDGMEIVERGSCLAFGWIGISSSGSSNSSNSSSSSNDNRSNITSSSTTAATAIGSSIVIIEDEKYAVLTRGKRLTNSQSSQNNKSKSILSSVLGGFRSSSSANNNSFSGGSGEQGETEEGEFEVPVLLFKQIQVQVQVQKQFNTNTIGNNDSRPNISSASDVLRIMRLSVQMPSDSTNSGSNSGSSGSTSSSLLDYDIDQPSALYGGSLLCISSLLKTFSKTNKNNNATSGVSGMGGSGAYSLTTASVQSSATANNTTKPSPNKNTTTNNINNNSTTGTLKMSTLATVVTAQNNAATMDEEGVGNDSKISDYTLKSRFYHIVTRRKKVVISSSTATTSTTTAANSTTATGISSPAVMMSGDEWDLALEPVGPCMTCVSAVSWDYTTSLAAVLIKTRINILRLQPAVTAATANTNNNSTTTINNSSITTIELITIASVDIAHHIYMIPTSLYWQQGILYSTTPTTIFMVATTYPYMFQSKSDSDSNDDNSTSNQILPLTTTTADVVVDVIILATRDYTTHGICASRFNNSIDNSSGSNFSTNQSVYSYYNRLNNCWLEVVGCQQGKIILSARDRDCLMTVPLHSNSIAIITTLLNQSSMTRQQNTNINNNSNTSTGSTNHSASTAVDCPYVTQAVEWASHLPPSLHDTAALLFIKRGLIQQALSLPYISPLLIQAIKKKFGLKNLSSSSSNVANTTTTAAATAVELGGSSMVMINNLQSLLSIGSSRCDSINIPSTVLSQIEQA